jgi:acyl-CoA reductase-like NAD-dependent aldehyde dehydrogenase
MKLLIGGELVEGDGGSLDIEEPARGEVFATLALPSEDQVDAAIGAARAAARGWAAMSAGERAELLHYLAIESELERKDWWYPYG